MITNLTESEKVRIQDGAYQNAKITVTTKSGDTIFLTNDDIKESGLFINRTSVAGDKIELGSLIASELTLQINSLPNSFTLESAELDVKINCADKDISLGHFIIDEVQKSYESTVLVALDNIVKFDKEANILAPITVKDLINQGCLHCGVNCSTDLSVLPNCNYIINEVPTSNVTWRQIISWCCQIMGVCGYCNGDGNLVLKWYGNDITDIDKITPDVRFSSSIDENAVSITGITMTKEEKLYISGTSEYTIDISGNELISIENVQAILDSIAKIIVGFTYKPFSATTCPMFWLEPFDTTIFVDSSGTEHLIAITDSNYTVNRNTSFAGQGSSAQKQTYSQQNPFTPQQSQIVDNKVDKEEVEKKNRSLLALNEAINAGLMLYKTEISGKIYYHNSNTLEKSNYIATANTGGFAFTRKGWSNGNPEWEYGISSNGEAILNILRATKISADLIEAGKLVSQDGKTYFDLDGNQIVTETDKSDGDEEYTLKSVSQSGQYNLSLNKKKNDDDENKDEDEIVAQCIISPRNISLVKNQESVPTFKEKLPEPQREDYPDNFIGTALYNIALRFWKIQNVLDSPNTIGFFAFDSFTGKGSSYTADGANIDGDVNADRVILNQSFSDEGITLANGVTLADAKNQGGTGATPVEMRFTGSKVQVRGFVSFNKESSTKQLLTFDTKLYPAPKIRNRYIFVPCSSHKVMRMYITTENSNNSIASIRCEWIMDLEDGTVYTGPMAWAQIDAEWETD
ncbi:MAG: hypothetical protein NC122_05100 [Faecalibacterium sp.]|nr:hypothetical protein [Ruminococcus sp.]MCM1391861.1 hypothetical protein [Ruminococcus sp.]MCM1485563.1 hypothetical protein [Faecalibacterium sp.]